MEAVSALNIPEERCGSPVESAAAKARAADSISSVEEAGQSTVCCSSEDEFPSGEAYPSDDERLDSDTQLRTTPLPPPEQHAADLQQQFSRQVSQQPGIRIAPYTYTLSSLEHMTVGQAPTSWLKPRIKIDGPEVFHGATPVFYSAPVIQYCTAPNRLSLVVTRRGAPVVPKFEHCAQGMGLVQLAPPIWGSRGCVSLSVNPSA